jgi:hydroxymethylglutaryl-CoA synthase
VVADYLIDRRSLNPPFEDTVTMGANAARPVVTPEVAEEIGLLVVGTEGGVDFGKPISTHLHEALELPSSVANFEVKHACYSGVAALDTALSWIAGGRNRGRKALIVATDFSRGHLGEDHEFVLGGAAVAALVSDTPRVVAYDLTRRGTWTCNVYDTFRPTATAEVGNNQLSLLTYLDALEGAFTDFVGGRPEAFDLAAAFARNVYHMPFPGMAYQAHRTLWHLTGRRGRDALRDDFERRVAPSLTYARQLGSQYGASNFVGLLGLLDGDPSLAPGDTVGFFAYGSGAIGEFYAGTVSEDARETVAGMEIGRRLDERREVDLAEYEALEREREAAVERRDWAPDLHILDGWYGEHYEGRDLLVLEVVEGWKRRYRWA